MYLEHIELPEAEYTVSHTAYKDIVEECHLETTLESLNPKAIILEMGSGLHQEFAKGIKNEYPSVEVISVDPTLAILKNDESWKVSESGSFVTFNKVKGAPVREIQEKRLKNIEGEMAIATDAKANLPIKDECIDVLIDNKGPGLYLQGDELKSYLKEVYRVLKPGGRAHISNFLRITNASIDPLHWKEKSAQEINDLLVDVIKEDEFEIFSSKSNAGVIIKKKK